MAWMDLRGAAARVRPSLLAVVAVVAYLVGVGARWAYILVTHHPRNFVQSDAMPIMALAEILADRHGRQQFFHTIWPPGASAFFALTVRFDPTLGAAAGWQFVLSCLVPLLVGHATRLACGARAGWIALTMAALHFGFIHYGGFFLAEQLVQFAVALALWTSVMAMVVPARWRMAAALISGAAWGLAFSFRPNALPIALFAGAWLALRWWRRGRRQALLALGGAAVGLLLVLVPLAHRCTLLLGKFCPGSSNFAMNVALGHAPEVAGLYFKPQGSRYAGGPDVWYPPARLHHGYRGSAEVPASLYETAAVLAWVKDRFLEEPVEFVVASVGNVFDLFGSAYWPDNYAYIPARRATVWKQLILFLVLAPGLVVWGLNLRRMIKGQDLGDREAFFTAVIGGLFLLAAASLGEARYRIPFDAFFIVLAARGWAGVRERPVPGGRVLPAGIVASATILTIALVALLATAHPRLLLAARLFGDPTGHGGAGSLEQRRLWEMGPARPEGSAWNGPGNVVFRCQPGCPELTIDLQGLRRSGHVEVSSDHNDRYEMVFLNRGASVGRLAWGAFEGAGGLRVLRLEVPARAQDAGYDTLAVRPLYGDGQYSVGHLLLY
jgi:hypothetical protein